MTNRNTWRYARVMLCSLVSLLCVASYPLFAQGRVNVSDELSPTHMKAAVALEKGNPRDVLIILQGMNDHNASLLRGMARFDLREYAAAARDLSGYRRGISSRYAYLDQEEKDIYYDALNTLMLAYYHSDQLAESLEVSEELMQIKYSRDIMEFQSKVRREMTGSGTRLSEASDHFKVIYDGYEHGKVDRKVLSILEAAYRETGRQMDYFPSSPITVVLDTSGQFHDITQSPRWAGGVFKDGRIRIPVGGLETFNESEVRRVLNHEYVHALIYSITANCPRWVHEGMAEYFSRGPASISGRPQLPLRALEGAFYSNDVRAVAFAYMDSYRAINALIERYGLYEIKLYLEALAAGQQEEEAFRFRFHISYDEFIDKFGG